MSLHLSKCHIVGNHMSWLKCNLDILTTINHLIVSFYKRDEDERFLQIEMSRK